jgi:hypothetical protein
MAKKFLTPIGLVSLPSDPANGVEGQVYFNTTIDSIKIYANGVWAQLQGGGGSGSTQLNDLSDVSINGINNDDLIVYNSASSIWVNSPKQNIINTASAAAYASASTHTNTSLIPYLTQTSASSTYIPQTSEQSIINTASAAASYSASSTYIPKTSEQSIINTASAAASANTLSQINALTTSDIEEGSNLYYTNIRGLTTASSALVHNNHTNLTATYDSQINQIILTASAGGGGGGVGGDGASVFYSIEQPDTSQLSIGDIWVDSNASVGYSGSSAPYVNQLTFWLEDDNGNLLPDADNVYSVGSSAFRVKDLYLGASSLYIKSPNSNTNIPITIDSNNDVTFNNSKLITLSNAESNLNLSSYATQSYARSASANALSSASAYTNAQLASIDLSSTIQTASAAAVNYLIDGAPAALNTLNELAEALNDNADILDLYLTQSSASTQYEKLIPYSSSAPISPTEGDLWVDSTVPTIKAYISGVWTSVGGGAADSDQAIIAGRMFA